MSWQGNTNAHGDQWNQEDLSVWSRDQAEDLSDLNSGGRILEVLVRPYARMVAGTAVEMRFEPYHPRRLFEFTFAADKNVTEPTEIFVPHYQYPNGYTVSSQFGTYVKNVRAQTLLFYVAKEHTSKVHTIRIEME